MFHVKHLPKQKNKGGAVTYNFLRGISQNTPLFF